MHVLSALRIGSNKTSKAPLRSHTQFNDKILLHTDDILACTCITDPCLLLVKVTRRIIIPLFYLFI